MCQLAQFNDLMIYDTQDKRHLTKCTFSNVLILVMMEWFEIQNIEYLKNRVKLFHDIKFFNCTLETMFSEITFFSRGNLKEMVIYIDIMKLFGNMIRRKVRYIKLKRYNLPGRTDQAKLLICQRKNLCKSFTVLSFTLSNEALNLTKPDTQ